MSEQLRMVIKKHMRIRKRGSYTVEAAITIPIVIGVILFVLYICIFSYDRVVIHHAIVSELYKDVEEEEDAIISEQITESVSNKIRNNVIANWEVEVNTEIDTTSIVVSVNAYMNHSQGLISMLIDNKMMSIRLRYSKYRLRRL